MSAEKKGIKEVVELVKGLEVVGIAGATVMGDGKLDLSDVVALKDLADKHEVLMAAVKGLGDVVPEIKDLDMSELAAIGANVVSAAKAIKAAHDAAKV